MDTGPSCVVSLFLKGSFVRSFLPIFYDSVVHVEMTVNVCVGYIGWKPHVRWEQQARHNHHEQQSTMKSIVNREAIERINRTR